MRLPTPENLGEKPWRPMHVCGNASASGFFIERNQFWKYLFSKQFLASSDLGMSMSFLRALMEDGGLRSGQWKRLPKSRRFVIDYLHFAGKTPSQPLVRHCRIPDIVELRKKSSTRIGWSTIFIKAYALVAAKHPELRSFLMPWPWMHVYEHPHQVVRVAMTKRCDNEDWLFFLRIEQPEELTLEEIQKQIQSAQESPIDEIPLFRLHRVFSSLPFLLRRPLWWMIMNLSGAVRAGLTGTFGMTSVSKLGAISVNPPTLGNMVVTFGPVSETGAVRATFVYDHRMFDGATVAEYLAEFEESLNTAVREELAALSHETESRAA